MVTRKCLLVAFKTYDALMVAVCLSLALALAARDEVTETGTFSMLSMRLELYKFLALFAIVWASHVVYSAFGLYGSRRLETWRREAADLLWVMVVVAALTVALAWAVGFELRTAFAVGTIFMVLGYVLALGSRVLLRTLLGAIRSAGRNLNHVLIVGTNARARRAAAEIAARPDLGCRLVGFVDEHWHEPRLAAEGHRIVASVGTLPDYLRDSVVDEVIICIPVKSLYDEAVRALEACKEQGVGVRFMPDIFPGQAIGFEDFDVVCSVLARRSALAAIKRAGDVLVAASLLVLLVPLFACVSLLIKADSKGPVLFVQERVGLNKRRFKLYKFRTMTVDAESRRAELQHLNETAGPTFKISNDPRVTRIGRVLRRSSIDELPQLINVLFGDMSLVGPRPLPVFDYAGFQSDRHRKRLSVRPGITCLWQVQGRSAIPFDRWMELDLKYVDQWSLWLDLKILIKTIPAVFRASGAS